jgi:LacI family transcriptional regulator
MGMHQFRKVAVLMNLGNVYDRGIIRGITKYVHSNGRWQLYVEEDPADKLSAFAAWSGEGLIVDLDDGRIAKAIPQFAGKVVGIGCLAPQVLRTLDIATVKTDDQMIAEWAADHLVEKGLEHFAYCGMYPRGLDQWDAVRRESFCRRILRHGGECAVFTGRQHLSQHWSPMLKELTEWLEKLPKPVGLMACNDSQGRYVLEGCRQLDIRVPQDVAVIGVDNDELMCELAIPPLSSIAQRTEQIGFRAAELLDELMAGRRRRPVHLTVPPACVVTRQSSDIVALDDEVVSHAVEFIRDHSTELVGVPEIAHQVGVSQSTLEKRFKALLGRTVHDELQKRRLDIARRLLTSSKLPLQVIAERSGFRSAHYMSAVFRREVGYPPGQLR